MGFILLLCSCSTAVFFGFCCHSSSNFGLLDLDSLDWVSLAGFAANASVPVGELDPTVEFWTDISLEHGGGLSSLGDFVQRSWTSDPSTNLLETRAACESVMTLSEPGDLVMLHIANRIAAAYIRSQGDSRSNVLSQEALLLWEWAVSRYVPFLPPQ